jgi:hypothetical protein
MNPGDRTGWRAAASGLMRSYLSDLRRWAVGLSTRYIVAVVIAVGGVLAAFAACAVGITALFHLIENQYGTGTAYAAIGGGLLFVGMILLVLAWTMLRAQTPPLPRPHRQVQSARRMMVRSSALRAVKGVDEVEGARTSPAIPVLIAAAATLLMGWLVGSRVRTERRERKNGAVSVQ